MIIYLSAAVLSLTLYAQPAPEWLWANHGGDNFIASGYNLTTDNDGNCYITGYFYDSAAFGSTTLVSNGDADIFVAKLDSNGNWLWAVNAGGASEDYGNGISADNFGNIYLTGYFYDQATFGSDLLNSSGDRDILIAKLDSNGNWLWARRAGGIGYDSALSVVAESSGGCLLAGWFAASADFGTDIIICSGDWDAFAARLDANGNWLWARRAGGTGEDGCLAIAVDNVGNSFLTGTFKNTAWFGTNSLTSLGDKDIYIAGLDANGNWLWASQAGGTGSDVSYDIITDSSGNCYIAGGFNSNAAFGSQNLNSSGGSDAFAAKLDSNGNWLWAVKAGGAGNDDAFGISIDRNYNHVCFTGAFYSTALFGTTTLISNGEHDIFIAELDEDGNWLWATQAGGLYSDVGWGINIDVSGNCFITGEFVETADFGLLTVNGSGFTDIFAAKLEGPVPQAPANLIISKSGNDIRLDWDSVSNAQSYKVYGVNDPYTSEPWTHLITTELTSYTFTGTAPQYFFKVVADTEP